MQVNHAVQAHHGLVWHRPLILWTTLALLAVMRSRLRWLAAVALAAGLALAPVAALAQATPTASPTEQAITVAKSGVVYIEIEYTGYVQPPDEKWYGPFTVTVRCSGFVASPDGYIATAAHCVDNKSQTFGGKESLVHAAVNFWLTPKGGKITQAAADKYLAEADQFGVEGKAKGSDPTRKVTVYQTVAASGLADQRGKVASVEAFKPFFEGDVALLKIDAPATPLPVLAVASTDAQTGSDVIAIGYSGDVKDTVDPSVDPEALDGRISGRVTENGVPFLQVSAKISPGMSGGPGVNLNGEVVGLVSHTFTGNTEHDFISATSELRQLLLGHQVQGPSATDQAFRQGVAEFYSGKYHAAAATLQKVLDAVPNHAQAQALKAQATTRFPQEDAAAAAKSSGSNVLLFLVVGLVLLLVAGGAVVLLRRRSQSAGSPHRLDARPESAQPPSGATQVFCNSCGHGNPPDSRFCSQCSNPLQRSDTMAS